MGDDKRWSKRISAVRTARCISTGPPAFSITGTAGIGRTGSVGWCSRTGSGKSPTGASSTFPPWRRSSGANAFQNAEGARILTIPSTLTQIGDLAFSFGSESRLFSISVSEDNPVFASRDGVLFSRDGGRLIQYPSARRRPAFTVPDTVTELAEDAFEHCRYLHRIDLPKGLKRIGSGAFAFCRHLEELEIPEGVEGIPSYAFFCCERLERLKLPSRAEYLGFESVCSCSRLTEVRLPDGITQIDYAAVGGNPMLRELVIPEGVTELSNSALIDNTGLQRIVLPSTLLEIWDRAFERCQGLEELVIPENVRYIDSEAFLGCTRLKRIVVKSKLIERDDWLPEELAGQVEVIREA